MTLLFWVFSWFLVADAHAAPCDARYAQLLARVQTARAQSIPTHIETRAIHLQPLTAEDLKQARAGTRVPYLVDQNNRLWRIPENEALPADRLIIVGNARSPDESPRLVMESGTLIYDADTRRLRLHTTRDLGLSEDERAQVVAEFNALSPPSLKSRIAREPSRSAAKETVVNCLEAAQSQAQGRNLIRDQLISSNLIMGTVVTFEEVRGAGRLNTPEGRGVLLGDWIGANVNAVVYGALGSLSVLGVSKSVDLTTRLATGVVLTAGQNIVYRQTVPDSSAEERANQIMKFDYGYMAVRTPIALGVDHVMLNHVPDAYFNACARDSRAKLIVHPTMIRIVERIGTTLTYYRARQALINE